MNHVHALFLSFFFPSLSFSHTRTQLGRKQLSTFTFLTPPFLPPRLPEETLLRDVLWLIETTFNLRQLPPALVWRERERENEREREWEEGEKEKR
uniref:Secreted protein n=1 Tax=Poecilia mexicana TaxID=48701 RepID=A0A3B3WR64_9TELE